MSTSTSFSSETRNGQNHQALRDEFGGQIDARPFIPPLWLPEGQSQTIIGSRFARYQAIDFARERLTTPDQDFIDLDWNIPGEQTIHMPTTPTIVERPQVSPFAGPALVLFHGLEGSSQSHYAQSICHDLRTRNWAVVVAHFRCCSGENNRLARSYFSGDTQDVHTIMQRLQERLPYAQWHAAGVSMGGSVLLKYIGEQGHAVKHLQAVAAISAPTDLYTCAEQLTRGFFSRAIYTPYFLISIKKKMRIKHQMFGNEIPLEKILAAKTLFEFDDVYTGPIHGFRDAADYYTRCSAKPGLIDIRAPCLLLNAQNDPFVPASSLPKSNEVSSYVTLHQPKHGGHVGFSQGRFPSRLGWLSQRLLDFFNTSTIKT